MKKLISVLLVIAMLVPMLCVDVFAQETTVNSFDGLKTAIANAADGDTITVNGDITITQTLMITKNITIKSDGTKTLTSGPLKMDSIEGCNMFYVSGDKELKLEKITLDGANEARLIRAKGAKINLTDVIMKNGSTGKLERVDNNGENDQNYSGGAILAEETSVVTINGGSFLNNNTGSTALDGRRAAEGGAIKIDSSVLTINGTKFEGNHLDNWETAGGRQGGAIEATNTTISIENAEFTITGPFNTGGAIKFENCTSAYVNNSKFTILGGKKPVGMAGGAITSEGSYLTIDNSKFYTGKGSYVQESGGLIQVVGTGTFNLKNSELNGSGVGWNATGANKTAKYGGAIVFHDNSTVKATIENTTIQNFTAEISGGAIALNTQVGKSGGTNLTLIDTKLLNNLAYAYDMSAYGGGVFVGKGNTVTMKGGQISSEQYSSVGGAIYNEGKLTLTKSDNGNAQIINNKAYHMAGGVLNDGELIVDYANFSGNAKGDWSTGDGHVYNKDEMSGINIYAVKDVTITPNAKFDGKDVRILDGQSKIILTGELTNQINVSISETAKPDENGKNTDKGKVLHPKFFETQKRKVGYVVAEPDAAYKAKIEEENAKQENKDKQNESLIASAKQIHYVSKDTSQAIAEFTDHTSPGKWDYVLNPETKEIVLGQRVKLIYHGNTGKIGTEEKKEKTVDVYKNTGFLENQLEEYKVADPTRDKYSFMAWYYWKDQEAGDTEKGIQNIKQPDNFKDNLFDFSKVKFSSKGQNEIVDIITPNVINTYAGWSKNIDLDIVKVWDGAKESDKQNITVTLYDGETSKEAKTFESNTNYGGKFENLPVFTKSYEGDEKNMNLRFSSKVYKVEEAALEGFTTTYAPATITSNSDDAKKIIITNKKEEPKTYKVTYKFITASTGRQLPKKVTDQLPKEETGKENGATVTPSTSTFNSVVDGDGTWTFKGWIKEAGKEDATNLNLDSDVAKSSDESLKRKINGADVKYVGVWVYENKPVKPDMVHRVIYEFKSGTDGKELPTDTKFTALLPKDSRQYNSGEKVTAEDPAEASYKDTDGTWTFIGWDKKTDTIKGDNVTFIGTWTFEEKEPKTKYKVTYKFKAKNTDKKLPDAINELLPNEETNKLDKTEVKPSEPKGKTYEDNENNGTWTFTDWDKTTDTIKDADVTFTGYWTFAAKPTPEPTSDFTIKKSVDRAYYEKAGDELTYTITVTNTGKTKLENLILSDPLMNKGQLIKPTEIKPFKLDVNGSETFTYTYTITDDDVRARKVINVASVKIGEDGKPKEATAKSILKTRRGDVYVRYETEDGKILDEFAVELGAPIDTYYYTEEKAFHGYRYIGLAPYSDPPEGRVIEGTLYVVYLYRERPGRTPDRRRDRYEREEKEEVEPITEAKRKPELNKKDHKQYMYGYPDWTFVPEANITRGEAAAMFARLFKEYPGLDYDFKKYYTDVERTYWGFKEISYLSEFGILSGYSDGTFRPNNKITRAEFVKIAESFEALMWGLSPYKDVDGGHWAFRYIVSSAAKGWINGYLDGTFRPDSCITRAEAVTIVNRLLERRPDKDYIDTHKPELKPFTDLKPSYWAYYEIYEAVEGHFYNRGLRDADEHWWRLTDERFVFSLPRYNY